MKKKKKKKHILTGKKLNQNPFTKPIVSGKTAFQYMK